MGKSSHPPFSCEKNKITLHNHYDDYSAQNPGPGNSRERGGHVDHIYFFNERCGEDTNEI